MNDQRKSEKKPESQNKNVLPVMPGEVELLDPLFDDVLEYVISVADLDD
jgi:hypothetical protein